MAKAVGLQHETELMRVTLQQKGDQGGKQQFSVLYQFMHSPASSPHPNSLNYSMTEIKSNLPGERPTVPLTMKKLKPEQEWGVDSPLFELVFNLGDIPPINGTYSGV